MKSANVSMVVWSTDVSVAVQCRVWCVQSAVSSSVAGTVTQGRNTATPVGTWLWQLLYRNYETFVTIDPFFIIAKFGSQYPKLQ